VEIARQDGFVVAAIVRYLQYLFVVAFEKKRGYRHKIQGPEDGPPCKMDVMGNIIGVKIETRQT